MVDMFEQLSNICETQQDKYLSTMTTLRIGGKADYVVYPDSEMDLDSIMRLCKEHNMPFKIIGKGSDLLCSDDDYHGVIIRLDKHFNDVSVNGNTIAVQAGCSLIALAVLAMNHSLSGLEFASGIPATVGGAIYMNAGAYKSSISNVLKEVFVYRDGRVEWLDVNECEFAYRSSIFQKHPDWIIIAARFVLEPGDKEEISSLMENRRQRRFASQPLEYPSCGSVFRNPEGYNAWELIDGIGYRGKNIGGAYVSDKHCNFIVNKDHASANDYLTLVEEIQTKVKEKYGIELHTEVEKFNW